jgi:hypothetical protein
VKFEDHSPPACPSLDQQRDALGKGLGRAWQWALNGRLDDEPLLEACFQDQRHDWQCEPSRGSWLWQLVEAASARRRFRVPILHALYDLSDERSADQLCELARFYAETGDQVFRDRLYEIVKHKPFPNSAWLGEPEIIALDGERAFLFAARVRGELLLKREWELEDGLFVDGAIKRFGEQQHVVDLLGSSQEAATGRFADGWKRQRATGNNARQAHRDRMKAIPVEQIIREAESESKCYWFRGWGMHAEEADLKTVLQRLWTVEQPDVIAKLLRVFVAHPLPQFDARLIDLCRHGDKDVERWALAALNQNSHPLIREFALAELQSDRRTVSWLHSSSTITSRATSCGSLRQSSFLTTPTNFTGS